MCKSKKLFKVSSDICNQIMKNYGCYFNYELNHYLFNFLNAISWIVVYF